MSDGGTIGDEALFSFLQSSEGVLSLSDEGTRTERAAEDDVPVRKGRVYTRVTGDSTSGETRRLPNHLND